MITPPKRIISKQLGELLLDKKIINERQLQKALAVQKDKGGLIGGIFVLLGYATEEQDSTITYNAIRLPVSTSYQL